MHLDYSLLVDNIKRRRYDEAIRSHVLSPSFEDESMDLCVRYALESMQEVDSAYAYKVYANTRKIHEILNKVFKSKGIKAVVRYQGPLRTDTHIRLYGEVDMLFILEEEATHKEVFQLGQILKETVSKIPHQGVDYSDGIRIKLHTQKPNCKINLIPAAWINNPQFMDGRNEIYRGIVVYNFKNKTRKKHLPFLNMARMYNKDIETEGGYKRMIRLLKSLATDDSIALSSYELAGMVYRIDDEDLRAEQGRELSILPKVSSFVRELVEDKSIMDLLLSPSDKELVFGTHTEKFDALKKLDRALTCLIKDLSETLGEDLGMPVGYVAHTSDNSSTE